MISISDELEAMRKIADAIERTLSSYAGFRGRVRQAIAVLDPGAQERVLRWADDRYPQLHLKAEPLQAEAEGPEAGQ